MELRPGNGIALNERREFVVVGQAFQPDASQTLEAHVAINEAMRHLTYDDASAEWVIPQTELSEYSLALGTVKALYDRLKSGEDRGSWAENASPEYRRLNQLSRTANELLNGIFTKLGIPEEWQVSDD